MIFFSTGEMAKILKITRWSLIYLIENGKIEEPMRIGGKRVFSANDLEKIRQFLQERKKYEPAIRRNETANTIAN